MITSTPTFLVLGILFSGIGAYAWRRKDPMWFWSGTTVNPDTVSDIPAYNRANAIMWMIYALPYWAGALFSRSQPELASQFVGWGATLGSLLLVPCYLLIRRKYRRR